MVEAGKRFVLKRFHWPEDYEGKRSRQPGEVAVASFATLEEAETERAKREKEFRKGVNPFDCGAAVQYWTHLDEPRLRDWLMDHGIDPPVAKGDGTTDWSEWWKKNHTKFSADKVAVVWEILDKVRFFAVREEPVRPVGFAVIGINWEYNDENFNADLEGGHFMTVYRSRERAEAECKVLNEEAREQWGGIAEEMMGEFADDLDEEDMMPVFDMQERLKRKYELTGQQLKKNEGCFNSAANVPFYEVIEIELEGLE